MLPEILDGSVKALSEWVVRAQVDADPELSARLGSAGIAALKEDTRARLAAMAEAASVDSDELFAEQMAWMTAMHTAVGNPASDIIDNLKAMNSVLSTELPPVAATHAERMLNKAIERARTTPPARVPEPMAGASALARRYLLLLLEGKRDEAIEMLVAELARGIMVREIYSTVLMPVMHEVGRLWHAGELGIGEEHYCTAATFAAMARLAPMQTRAPATGRTALVTSVGGDLHELGIRMVADEFEFSGWRVHYLGPNTPAISIIQSLDSFGADVVAISAKTVYHLRIARDLIRAIRSGGFEIPIIVGGIPFTQIKNLHARIGADASAATAAEAVEAATRLIA